MENPTAIKLEYNYKKDEVIRYKAFISSEQTIVEHERSTAHNFSVDTIMSARTIDILPDDIYALQYTIESGTITKEQSVMPLPNAGEKFIMEIMKNGEVMRTSLNFPFTQPAFPDGPLAIGYTWEDSSEISFPFEDKSLAAPYLSFTYTYTLKELSTLAGQECAIITVTCPETRVNVKENYEMDVSGSGKIYFAHREGKLIGSYIKNTYFIHSPDIEISSKISTKVELMP
jgi:hypothetical protein